MAISMTALMAFGASVFFFWGVYLIWLEYFAKGSNRFRQRLDQLAASSADFARGAQILSLARIKKASYLDKMLWEIPGGRRLDHFLEKAGVEYGLGQALARVALSGIIAAGLAMLLFRESAELALPLGFIIGVMIPVLRYRKRRTRRVEHLVRQLPEAMDFFARSLRAGNPFVGALRAAPDELAQPIAGELAIAFDEMNYGLEFEEVMENLAERIDADEVRFFVTAVLVQKSTGGNLAEIMNRISTLLRERIKTRGEVMIHAAEMRASAHVLIGLPFFIAGVLQLLSPSYFNVLLQSSTGYTIIIVQLTLMLIGYLIIRRMINFRI